MVGRSLEVVPNSDAAVGISFFIFVELPKRVFGSYVEDELTDDVV